MQRLNSIDVLQLLPIFIEELLSNRVDINIKDTKGALQCNAPIERPLTMLDAVDGNQDAVLMVGDLILSKYEGDRAVPKTLKRTLSDASTKYMCSRMFDDATYQKYLDDFFLLFKTAIETYIESFNALYQTTFRIPDDIVPVYKGGNLFRLYLKPMIDLLQCGDFSRHIERSDADFSVYISPTRLGRHYKRIFKDIRILCIRVIESFRVQLISHRESYLPITDDQRREAFDFFQTEIANFQSADPTLQINLESIRYCARSTDPTGSIDCPLDTKPDFHVIFSNKLPANDGMFSVNIEMPQGQSLITHDIDLPLQTCCPCDMYISDNTALKFRKLENVAHFDLVRMKVLFVCSVSITDGRGNIERVDIKAPSELIDISIPCEDDERMKLLDAHGFASEVSQQKWSGPSPSIWTYSLSGLTKDVEAVLFDDNDYPWQDPKYEKRLVRFMLCLTLQILMIEPGQTKDQCFLAMRAFAGDVGNNQIFDTVFLEISGDPELAQTMERFFDHIRKYAVISQNTNHANSFTAFATSYQRIMTLIIECMRNQRVQLVNAAGRGILTTLREGTFVGGKQKRLKTYPKKSKKRSKKRSHRKGSKTISRAALLTAGQVKRCSYL